MLPFGALYLAKQQALASNVTREAYSYAYMQL
jgi:hypothetical protein